MCSYRRINNPYACANGKTLNGLRKTELGFQGFVVTDWAAQHNWSRRTGYETIVPDGAISGHLGDPEDTSRALTSKRTALETRAHGDGTALLNDSVLPQLIVDPASEAHTVFRNVLSCEAYNQPALQDKYADDLVKSVAADSCSKIIHDNARRRALCGQQLLASLLYGESTSPRAKLLPATLARDETDYPVRRPSTPERRRVALFPQSGFSKGRATFGHGHFDKEDTTPRFELGFGLS
ncbi:hypothetical protein MY1884_008700 [Beauveria asiatica]